MENFVPKDKIFPWASELLIQIDSRSIIINQAIMQKPFPVTRAVSFSFELMKDSFS